MKNNNPIRRTRAGKVIPLNEYEPLLKSIGYETLIGMITPEEFKDAEALLEKYLRNFPNFDIDKKVILAYLFGVQQGINEMFEDMAGKTLANKMINAHRMGQQLGMTQAFLLFKQEEKK